ncbi:Nucleosome assembly protein (NAP) [Moelleriella libera RCEF 2490]|uniref:Nucleosome assembly protein (NAP) n=1 Tax=Moelleriella libera RCEF 2490 TaxID=1081109 RepID=A0A168E1D0_9HYPO|nr:Nucleosome assembly protein (NAP) [Moelleriella libera RCEF 2490]
MSAENVDKLPVHYEQLEDLQEDLEQVELELTRIRDEKTRDLLAEREKIVEQIPNFWPLVFEHAPPEIDEYIQPTDATIIVTALKKLSVARFELPNGHPRSISIKFEFGDNEYFEDTTLEKKFWWRTAKDGWAGLVSEPVPIKWKPGKDLTDGLLDLAKQIFDDEKAGNMGKDTPAKKALVAKLENTSLDNVSFFNFFGFRGRYISEEESRVATKAEEERRQARKAGKQVDEDEDEEEDDDDDFEFEVFPNADEVAVTIVEDLYPDAIQYFLDGENLAAMSDADFEDEEEEDGMKMD